MDKKRVLLTGAGGSIAFHFLAHIFTNTDWEVVGIDSMVHKGLISRNALLFNNHPQWAERYDLIIHDLTTPLTSIVAGQIGNIDYIINMASLSDVEGSIQDPVPFVKNNVDIMLNMLEYSRKVQPKAFIQIGTDEEMGAVKKGEMPDEWAPVLPSNPYSASKAAMTALGIAWWRTYNVPVILTNTCNNYGETQSKSKFPVIVQRKLMNDETVIIHGNENDIGARYYIHSRNFADAVLFILKNTTPYLHKDGEVDRPDRYNIISGDFINNLEFAQLIAKLMGKDLNYDFVDVHKTRPGHDRFYGLSGEKLKGLGWKSPITFEESLENTIKWQLENPNWIN